MTINRKLLYTLLAIMLLQNAILVFVTIRLEQADYGDLNHDGKVDLHDLSLFARHYGKSDGYGL